MMDGCEPKKYALIWSEIDKLYFTFLISYVITHNVAFESVFYCLLTRNFWKKIFKVQTPSDFNQIFLLFFFIFDY